MNSITKSLKRFGASKNLLSRRVFLRKSGFVVLAAGAGTSTFWAQTRRLGAASASSEQIRLGLIGCGGRGRDVLSVFLNHPEVDCPVICDVDPAGLAQADKLIEKKRENARNQSLTF